MPGFVGTPTAEPKTAVKQTEPTGPARTFLWRVQSPPTTIHILGSIHVAPPNLYPLDSRIEEAYARSEALVVEADIAGGSAAMAGLVRKYGMYPPGGTLKANLPTPVHRALQLRLSEIGLPASAVNGMKPWLAASTLSIMYLARAGYDASKGVDNYFLRRARGRKPIEQLESAEFQMRMFGSFSEKLQLTFLKQTLEELPGIKKMVSRMFVYWKQGDVAAMEKLVFPEDPARQSAEEREIDERIYYARNRDMTLKIQRYLAGKRRVFIVVGAGHLIGPAGIPALLRKSKSGSSYKIKRY